MANKIVFNYTDITNSVNAIKTGAEAIREAGNTLITNVDVAIEGADGASMNKFKTLMDGSVSKYVKTNIPDTIDSIAEVLQKNAEAMQESDEEIAKGIPDSI